MFNNINERIVGLFKKLIMITEYIFLLFCINRAIRNWTYMYFYIYFKYVDKYSKKLFADIFNNDMFKSSVFSQEVREEFYNILLENSQNINNAFFIILYNILGIIIIFKIKYLRKLILKVLTKYEKLTLKLLFLIIIFIVNYSINFLLFRNVIV